MSTMRLGGTAIVMEQFDPEDALAYIEQYHVTHSQWVPTMFVRMLKLPDEARTRYDLSSQKVAIHAAAPCSVEVKRKMIEWWGPIIDEYYAATEGMGATFINSADWLAHPGSVGKSMLGRIRILDDDGNELPAGEVGTVWFEPPPNRPGFEYHKDAEKTRDSFNDEGLVDRRRHGLPRRRRLPLPHRSPHVHDRVGRREHLSAGSRERAHRPPEGLRRRGVRHPRRGDGRARARRRAADRLGRRRARARTRAARVTCSRSSRTTSARRRSTSTASSRASRPASSTSACSATATGATRPHASSEP